MLQVYQCSDNIQLLSTIQRHKDNTMEFLSHYGLFLAQIVTLVIATLITLFGVVAIIGKDKGAGKEKLQIKKLNDKYEEMVSMS